VVSVVGVGGRPTARAYGLRSTDYTSLRVYGVRLTENLRHVTLDFDILGFESLQQFYCFRLKTLFCCMN